MDHHIPSPTSSHSGHERDDGPSHANAGAVSVFSETPNAALVSDSPHHVDDSHLSNWTAKQSDPVAPPLPIPTTGSDSSQQVGRLHPLPSSDADVHHAADPDDEASDSAAHTSARSSATAYSLDATHLRERVTSVGRLPKGTAASRRLAALFGDLPPTSPASTSSAASSTSSSTPTPASRDRPPRPQPRARSPSPPPASSHQRASHPTSPPATPTPTPTTSDSDTPSTAHPAPGSGLFECNICLDTASHPVVTLCGHLFCWPCLDPWFKACTSRHAAVVCPVCKSGCGPDKTIPIFARGREAVDPRTSPSSSSPSSPGQSGGGGAAPEATASPRPEAQRSEPVPPPRTWRNAWGFGAGQGVGGGGGVNVQFGMFPGLFGMTINLGDGGAGGPEAMRGDPQENQNISSVLTLMGVMILMNLFFGLFLY